MLLNLSAWGQQGGATKIAPGKMAPSVNCYLKPLNAPLDFHAWADPFTCLWQNIIEPSIRDYLNVDVISTIFLAVILFTFLYYIRALWQGVARLSQYMQSINNVFNRSENIKLLKLLNMSDRSAEADVEAEQSLEGDSMELPHADDKAQQYDWLKKEVSDAIGEKGFLHHKWSEFKENLIDARDVHQQAASGFPVGLTSVLNIKQRNSLQPEAFFDVDDVVEEGLELKGGVSLQNIRNASSLLVGLGALGTFLGLTIGITEASHSLQNPVGMDKGLRELLGGAGLAFVTSLFGLGSSIIFSWLEKRGLSRLRKQVKEFIQNIEKMFEFAPSEKILVEIEKTQRQQLEKLNSLDNDIAQALAGAMEDACGRPLKEAIVEMKASLDNLKDVQQSFSQDLLKQLVDKMSGNLLSGVEESQRRAADMIEELKQALTEAVGLVQGGLKEAITEGVKESNQAVQGVANNLSNLINQSQEEFSKMTEQAQAKHRESLEQFTTALAEVLQHHKQVNQSVENLLNSSKQAVENQNKMLEKQAHAISRQEQFLKTQLDHNEQLLSGFSRIVEHQKQLLDNFKKCAGDLGASSEAIKSGLGAMEQLIKSLTEATEQFKTSNDNLQSIWRNYEQRFNDVDKSMSQALEKIIQGTDELSKMQQNYVNKTIEAFKQALNSLSDQIDEFDFKRGQTKKE